MYDCTVRRPSGYIMIFREDGSTTEGDTLQCVHCNAHFVVRSGSGTIRGWCLRCGGPTCGHKPCDECIPFERRLESIEGHGRNRCH